MTENEAILEVKDLTKTFGGLIAVDGATFNIERGKITGLIGPNGAGKTTTFNLISGFLKPDNGTVRFKDRDLQEIMRPNRGEYRVWSTTGAITGGGIGIVGTSAVSSSVPIIAGGTLVGVGVGAVAYLGQKRFNNQVGFKRSRPFTLVGDGLARTFQITREIDGMTVMENLQLGHQHQPGERLTNMLLRPGRVAESEDEIRERAVEIIKLLELEHLEDEYAGNLSGGQRKLLELGRVLMTDPDLLLLDEPVAGVNPALTEKLLDRIKALREEGYTFCIIEHDMRTIMSLSDSIIVMSEGKKLVEGSPEEIRSDERVLNAYLGE